MSKALVLVSGGQDSVTCLYWALEKFGEVFTLAFNYGQRHSLELISASNIAKHAGVDHKEVSVPSLNELSPSALTRKEIKVDSSGGSGGLPSTFTPSRNLIFLTLASAYAISRGSIDLVTGVCQTDYSGYPDCRRDTINAVQDSIALGNDSKFRIHTPLMYLTKAETVRMARELGPECWEALGMSLTCYNGEVPGCGKCPSCVLRARGFEEAGEVDPTT